jgi:lipid-A-disaccharide synthase
VSGTASLHLVHHGTPSVVCYRTSWRGIVLAKVLLVAPFIALPNLLCGREVFPEFLTDSDDGEALAQALLRVLPGGEAHRDVTNTLTEITRRLHVPGVPDRAARWIFATE